jgi:NADH-quinone oxidoreductase subunit A
VLGYRGILLFAIVAFGLATFLLGVSWLRQRRRPYAEKLTPYECGFDTLESTAANSRHPFQVSFYRVGLLFVLFDLEIAFLMPWAVSLTDVGWFGFISMMVFLFVLTLGFVYEWHKGALQWIK